ncbi:MAG: hypothetical protein KatS3mg031_1690 [Chitinophagales bacterium]|nr:MAG: hypothetical protein KatS3mg031_1690 [Chitinophagales bacterium]
MSVSIPDNSCEHPMVYSFEVRDAVGFQLGIDIVLQEVGLIIRHSFTSDLEIQLRSPAGKTITLASAHGGYRNNYGNPDDSRCRQTVSFVREAPAGSLSLHDPPFIGRFTPDDNLDTFNDGSDPNGMWSLIICDNYPADKGTLEFVSLTFAPVSGGPPSERDSSNSRLFNSIFIIKQGNLF